MSIISDFEDRFENLLTVDATPSTPQTPVEDNLLDLFDLTGSPASKISVGRPLITSTADHHHHHHHNRQTECKSDPTSDIKFPSGKSNDPDDDADNESGGQKKNAGYKKKPRTKAKNASAINYNIINSNDVKICPKTSFICNINQHVQVSDRFPQKSKTVKPMPNSIRVLSDCKEEISQKDMLVIKQYMGSGWRDVARKLNYTEGQIEQFQENFSSKGMDEVVYQVLLDWKQANSKEAKLGILVKAIWSSHQYECVKELEKSRNKEYS